jgi:hypothetical protein
MFEYDREVIFPFPASRCPGIVRNHRRTTLAKCDPRRACEAHRNRNWSHVFETFTARMPGSAALKTSAVGLAFALGIQRIVNDELAAENFLIAQSQCAKAPGDPAKTLSCWMRIMRV